VACRSTSQEYRLRVGTRKPLYLGNEMDLLKAIHEDTKEPNEKHIKEEQDYFKDNIECLNKLVDYVNKEEENTVDEGRVKDYSSISKLSKKLVDELQKHLDSYK
jgi:hypothetical protein